MQSFEYFTWTLLSLFELHGCHWRFLTDNDAGRLNSPVFRHLFKIFSEGSDFPSKMWKILTEKFVFRLRAFCISFSPCLCLPQSFQTPVFPNVSPLLPNSSIACFYVCLFIASTALHFCSQGITKNTLSCFSGCFLAFRCWLLLSSLKPKEKQGVSATVAAAKGKSQHQCRREHGTARSWPSAAAMVLGQCLGRGTCFSQFCKIFIAKPQVSLPGNWGMCSSHKWYWLFFFFY